MGDWTGVIQSCHQVGVLVPGLDGCVYLAPVWPDRMGVAVGVNVLRVV